MRAVIWFFSGILLCLFVIDMICFWTMHEKIAASLEIATDAAIINSLIEQDIFKGTCFIDEGKAEETVKKYFMKNIEIEKLQRKGILKKTKLDFSFSHNATNPSIYVYMEALMTVMTPRLIGLEGIPIIITKEKCFQSNYR